MNPRSGDALRVGSVGYELHKDHREFAQRLAEAGIQRLIDVRRLANSRRRGYSKTALREGLAEVGIEYVHARALGNPKPFMTLYRAGRLAEGRGLYREHLVSAHMQDLQELLVLLDQKASALMCVEHDPSSCHRSVILDVLAEQLGARLEVVVIE